MIEDTKRQRAEHGSGKRGKRDSTGAKKVGEKKQMGKSAFKRFNSILETINIVYLFQQLLHKPLTPLCQLSPLSRPDSVSAYGRNVRFCLTLNEIFTSTVPDIFAQAH